MWVRRCMCVCVRARSRVLMLNYDSERACTQTSARLTQISSCVFRFEKGRNTYDEIWRVSLKFRHAPNFVVCVPL